MEREKIASALLLHTPCENHTASVEGEAVKPLAAL